MLYLPMFAGMTALHCHVLLATLLAAASCAAGSTRLVVFGDSLSQACGHHRCLILVVQKQGLP